MVLCFGKSCIVFLNNFFSCFVVGNFLLVVFYVLILSFWLFEISLRLVMNFVGCEKSWVIIFCKILIRLVIILFLNNLFVYVIVYCRYCWLFKLCIKNIRGKGGRFFSGWLLFRIRIVLNKLSCRILEGDKYEFFRCSVFLIILIVEMYVSWYCWIWFIIVGRRIEFCILFFLLVFIYVIIFWLLCLYVLIMIWRVVRVNVFNEIFLLFCKKFLSIV